MMSSTWIIMGLPPCIFLWNSQLKLNLDTWPRWKRQNEAGYKEAPILSRICTFQHIFTASFLTMPGCRHTAYSVSFIPHWERLVVMAHNVSHSSHIWPDNDDGWVKSSRICSCDPQWLYFLGISSTVCLHNVQSLQLQISRSHGLTQIATNGRSRGHTLSYILWSNVISLALALHGHVIAV